MSHLNVQNSKKVAKLALKESVDWVQAGLEGASKGIRSASPTPDPLYKSPDGGGKFGDTEL